MDNLDILKRQESSEEEFANAHADQNQLLAKSVWRKKLESWLNKNMKIEMTDGRTLIGIFLCTDRERNIILGSCSEYLKADEEGFTEEPRLLGLAMVPGHHVVSIHIDKSHGAWTPPQLNTQE